MKPQILQIYRSGWPKIPATESLIQLIYYYYNTYMSLMYKLWKTNHLGMT